MLACSGIDQEFAGILMVWRQFSTTAEFYPLMESEPRSGSMHAESLVPSRPGQQRRPIGGGQDALRERVEIVRLCDGRDRGGGVGIRAEPARGLPQDQVAPG